MQKTELKMFYQTQTARKPTKSHLPPPGSDRIVLSTAAWRHLQWVRSIPSLSGGDGSAGRIFCPWLPWPSTLLFKVVRARDQTCLPCEFGANPFSHSWDIWFTNKKTVLKTEPYLRAVTKPTNRQSCCNFWLIQLFHELRKKHFKHQQKRIPRSHCKNGKCCQQVLLRKVDQII